MTQHKPRGQRAVDQAMDARRPNKDYIRRRWVERVEEHSAQQDAPDQYLYLTLPGQEGIDLELLKDRGLLPVTETGAVDESAQGKFAAVESGSQAVLHLQKKFQGLRIYSRPIQELVRGNSQTRFPHGEDEAYCKARVINLDFNSALVVKKEEGGEGTYEWPTLVLVSKFARIHSTGDRKDWTLCLTLNASIDWEEEVCKQVQSFIKENIDFSNDFRESIQQYFGQDWVKAFCDATLSCAALDDTSKQRLLMTFVPKALCHYINETRWEVTKCENFRYEGPGGAPMVSWILDFRWMGHRNPPEILRASLAKVLAKPTLINRDGSVQEDSA